MTATGSIHPLPRLMPDPFGPGCRMLNDREYAACMRFVAEFSSPTTARPDLTEDSDRRAWMALWGMGYLAEVDDGPPPCSGIRWTRIGATAAGLKWLSQVKERPSAAKE